MIESVFNITWSNVVYDDLDAPIYSALAFRIRLALYEEEQNTPVPSDIDTQVGWLLWVSSQLFDKQTIYLVFNSVFGGLMSNINNLLCNILKSFLLYLGTSFFNYSKILFTCPIKLSPEKYNKHQSVLYVINILFQGFSHQFCSYNTVLIVVYFKNKFILI